VTLALALTVPLGAVASAAPPPKAAPAASPSAPPPSSGPASDQPAVPDPPPSALSAVVPLEVQGSLSKDSRQALADRLVGAVAAAKVTGGPYRARLSLRVSKAKKAKKPTYALTLTVLGSGDAVANEATDTCKGCSIDEVGARIDALVQRATESLTPAQPPPAAMARVAVTSEPPGARVRVDGVEHGVTPQTLELAPGEHTVVVDKDGFAESSKTLALEPGAEQALAVALVAQAAPKGKGSKRSKGPAGPADPKAGRGLKIGGGVIFGLGLVGVATGVAMILIDEDPMPQRCTGADVDFRGVCRYRYDTLTGGIVGVAAGALGVAGGMAMMIKGHQIAVRGRGGKGQASLSLTVRF
jgi:hypothetical protein